VDAHGEHAYILQGSPWSLHLRRVLFCVIPACSIGLGFDGFRLLIRLHQRIRFAPLKRNALPLPGPCFMLVSCTASSTLTSTLGTSSPSASTTVRFDLLLLLTIYLFVRRTRCTNCSVSAAFGYLLPARVAWSTRPSICLTIYAFLLLLQQCPSICNKFTDCCCYDCSALAAAAWPVGSFRGAKSVMFSTMSW
jgi:hypothetical protein